MSNHLAIATVTATLVQVILAAARKGVDHAIVEVGRPAAPDGGNKPCKVQLYLYQVVPNAGLRNADLPSRDSNGHLKQRPQAALDLHYLMAFYGNEKEFEPERMLGAVARALHARPTLTRKAIKEAISSNRDVLKTSDLADAVEQVRLTPMSLSLDELSKLWSVFFQTPHSLSVAYQASVVLIESEDTPRAVLPVRQRNVYVMPFHQPLIQEVASQEGPDSPIVVGSTLIVRGRQLRGDDTQLRIAGIEVTPAEVTNTQISVPLTEPPLPAGTLRAGVQGVQVVHRLLLGTPPKPHHGFESNIAPFVLRPTITTVQVANVQGGGNELRSADVTVTLSPKIRPGQRMLLLLNEIAPEAPQADNFFAGPRDANLRDSSAIVKDLMAYTFFAEPHDADSDSVTIPIHGVKAATYLVRIQVDGAESLLAVKQGKYNDPQVTIP